jgi:uncharacterized membrane protein HdeD (DUF308 family)
MDQLALTLIKAAPVAILQAIARAFSRGPIKQERRMTTMSDTMNANAGTTTLTHRWGWLLALGIVQIIAGSIAIAIPVVASFAAVAFFGAVLLVTATFQLIHAFKIGAWPRSAWYGLSGVLYAIAGLLVLAFPLGGALTLAMLIAILFIADGALRVVFATTVSAAVGRGWLIAAGCCGVIVGVFLLIGWPYTALWVTGLLLGVNLLITGAMNIAIAFASKTGTSKVVSAAG